MPKPDKIIVKKPDGSTQDAVLGQISDPEIAEDLELFRRDDVKLKVNGPVIKIEPAG